MLDLLPLDLLCASFLTISLYSTSLCWDGGGVIFFNSLKNLNSSIKHSGGFSCFYCADSWRNLFCNTRILRTWRIPSTCCVLMCYWTLALVCAGNPRKMWRRGIRTGEARPHHCQQVRIFYLHWFKLWSGVYRTAISQFLLCAHMLFS